MTLFTADVSSHDGAVDWGPARQAGISALAVKASEGGGPRYRYTSPLFAGQFAGGLRAGFELVGAYHCLSGDPVDQQIRYFQQAYTQGGDVPRPWHMLDVEPFDELRRSGALPDFSHVEAFADLWWSLGARALALYLPRWVWDDWGRPSLTGLRGSIALVSSNYPASLPRPFRDMYAHAGGDTGPGWVPYGGRTPDLWQFGSTALIPGVRGGVGGADINAYRGDYPGLVHRLTGALGPITTTLGDDVITPWSTIQRGATGDRVRAAQGLLISHGLPVGSRNGQPDGDFGPTTDRSTRDLQGRYGIAVDGQFGPITLFVALYRRRP